jgi:hypothetical protein
MPWAMAAGTWCVCSSSTAKVDAPWKAAGIGVIESVKEPMAGGATAHPTGDRPRCW